MLTLLSQPKKASSAKRENREKPAILAMELHLSPPTPRHGSSMISLSQLNRLDTMSLTTR